MHNNGFTHNDLHIGNVAVGYHNKSKIYLFGNSNPDLKVSDGIHKLISYIFFIDFSVADMNKSKTTQDLWFVTQILKNINRPHFQDGVSG